MPDLGLTHVALPVTDLEASRAFYARYGGLEVVHRREGILWLGDRTRPFVVVLAAVDAVEHPLAPFGHLGRACASRDEVDRLCARAEAEGRLVSPPQDSGPPVGYWAFLADPDGHTLELAFGQEVGLTVAADDPEPGP